MESHHEERVRTDSRIAASESDNIIYMPPSQDPNPNRKVAVIASTSISSGLWKPNCLDNFVGPGCFSASMLSTVKDWETKDDAEVSAVADQLKHAHGLCTDANDDVLPLTVYLNDDSWKAWHKLDSEDPVRAKWPYVVVAGAGEETNSTGLIDRRFYGVGVVLVAKICGALAAMGYECDAVSNVGKLVQRNLWTANAIMSEEDEAKLREHGMLDKDSAFIAVNDVLMKIWEPSKRNEYINSNEPVLLVNNLSGYSAADVQMISQTAGEHLQRFWGIRPVRVYAGSFMHSAKTKGFSLTLLNVCNTDIGGPSMIQLLDEPCNAPGWNNFVRKEIWNQYNLLSREDRVDEGEVPSSHTPVGEAFDASESKETTTKVETEQAEASIDQPKSSDEETAPGGKAGEIRSTDSALSISRPNTVEEVHEKEEPEADEQADESAAAGGSTSDSRPPVQYPTWQREGDGESLLEMIRRQSQKLGISSAEEPKAGNQYATAATTSAEAELSGEDDYEVL